jgi:predicted DNA-binding protein
MAKKTVEKRAGRGSDQYMIRFPDGLRDRLASRAAENGRSMNTEIVEAIERHLQGSDRISEMWQFIQEHREDIKAIDRIRNAIYVLEASASHHDDEFHGALRAHRDAERRAAEIAALPIVTRDQAATIRALVTETKADEKLLLQYLRAEKVEDIRGFERAVAALKARAQRNNPPG